MSLALHGVRARVAKSHLVGTIKWRYLLAALASVVISSVAVDLALAQVAAVTTYHYDNNRTGWNSNETTLNISNVAFDCPPGSHREGGHCVENPPRPSGTIFVDWQNSGVQKGTAANPYQTLAPALAVAAAGDTIAIQTGSYNLSGGLLDKPATFRADNGPVTIGHSAARFGLLHIVPVDEKVSAQPLLIPNQWIAGVKRDVVYVVTEANTIYAIDAASGAVLMSRTLSPAVSSSLIGCGDNGPLQGITSTPSIDAVKNGMYLISFTNESTDPANPILVHRLHFIDLRDLTDKAPPVTISASHTLADGTPYSFLSQFTRQRAGLVEANGNIYAGFASHCDQNADQSRGWLLGWNATTLVPLPANYLVNKLSGVPHYYLTSIWMSGFGVASDSDGNLYAVTGNTAVYGHGDCSSHRTTFNFPNNLSESAIKISGDLMKVLGAFWPDNVADLDCADNDFGSGGIMLLPDQPGSTFRLAVAAGKVGGMFLLDRDSMHKLANYDVGPCWCGPSYFEGSDGVNRVVSSGGAKLKVWQVWQSVTSGGVPSLVEESSTPVVTKNGNGFLTSVSSNLRDLETVIIWAVGRPDHSTSPLMLYAFDAKGNQLYKGAAGQWGVNGLAYSMPVVANGKVYVGGNRELAIFGLGSVFQEIRPLAVAQSNLGIAAVGVVTAVEGSKITLRKRDGTAITIEISKALASKKAVPLVVGKSIAVQGEVNAQGLLEAESISHGESILE